LVIGVLRADARIIEARRDRVRGGNLSVVALEQVRHAAVQDADPPRAEAGAVLAARDSVTTRFDPDDADATVADEWVEQPDGVGAAPTQATSTSGKRPISLRAWLRASLPMTAWKSRTIIG